MQNPRHFSNLSFFFPSLLPGWHSCVLADSPLPWLFPSMKLLSASDKWVLCLNSARAKGTATTHATTFGVWWIWAFTEIFITSPSSPLEPNFSWALFNLIYFLKKKEKSRKSRLILLQWSWVGVKPSGEVQWAAQPGRVLAHCWTSREGNGAQTAFGAAAGLHPWQRLFWKQAGFTTPVSICSSLELGIQNLAHFLKNKQNLKKKPTKKKPPKKETGLLFCCCNNNRT